MQQDDSSSGLGSARADLAAAPASAVEEVWQVRARAELYERLAAAFVHDLNNAFQGVLGPLWELEELTAALPAASPQLLRLHEACRRGMALVRLQSESFAAPSPGTASLAKLLEEAWPLLRHLLGVTHLLRLSVEPTALALTVNPRTFRRLLLHLCLSLGHALPASVTIEIVLGSAAKPMPGAPSTSEQAAAVDTGDSGLSLRFVARPRGKNGSLASSAAATMTPYTFTATEQHLAACLGVALRSFVEVSQLTVELQFPRAPLGGSDGLAAGSD